MVTRCMMIVAALTVIGTAIPACGNEDAPVSADGGRSVSQDTRTSDPGPQSSTSSTVSDEPLARPSDPTLVVFVLRSDGADYTHFYGYQAVTRDARSTDDPAVRLRDAIGALADGVTDTERSDGYRSSRYPSDRSLEPEIHVTDDGTAVFDFDDRIVEAAGLETDDAGVGLLAPLMATAFENTAVSALELWGNGSCETFASWIGSDVKCVRRSREQYEEWKATEPGNTAVTAPEDPPKGES